MAELPLGRQVAVPTGYCPAILHPIERKRDFRELAGPVSMHGLEHWRAYELSWLDSQGKPRVFVGELLFPADSPKLIESKSLKLYLASLNEERFASIELAAGRIRADLGQCCGARVEVQVWRPASCLDYRSLGDFELIDGQPLPGKPGKNGPDAGLLAVGASRVDARELRSELFRSICPVTGQPDWASVAIGYAGREIDEAALLAYLCSFRQHAAWHERCADQVFHDIMRTCEPERLSLSLHFLRRGGLEINVYRSTGPVGSMNLLGRDVRQ